MSITPVSELPPVPERVEEAMRKLSASESVKSLLEAIRQDDDATRDQQIEICEVPAPPFKENKRGELLLSLFRHYGLKDAYVDEVGNVLGLRRGTGNGPVVQIAAHLDTVFPEGTDVTVKKDGNTYRAPGISDDTRGLASMLCVLRQLDQLNICLLYTSDAADE